MQKIFFCWLLSFLTSCHVKRFVPDTAKTNCKAGSCGRPLDLRLGHLCVDNTGCESNHCVDGVCCESFCDGTCLACATILTGGPNGACLPLRATTDRGQNCVEPLIQPLPLLITAVPDVCPGQPLSGINEHYSNYGCVGVAQISRVLPISQGSTP